MDRRVSGLEGCLMFGLPLVLMILFSAAAHKHEKPVARSEMLYARVDRWDIVVIGPYRREIDRRVDEPWFYILKP